ncbi:hypothetical protein [Sphingomonas psychrotolerans]|uniref:Terminase n=1 Tax=Sphingomonas psychrotolerans TaxID=1327635 RepID=A0A2K8MHF8_9SPHN|nr:hypothetical protein [Sphingomonas psychrotolerans]ATY33332.1 hypothetical protein CVN68_16305 [Sphingomonas psychrotolerans]
MDKIITFCEKTGQRQKRRARAKAFTGPKRQRFLDALALTCNVEASAAHAGVHRVTPYTCRRRDPHFARQWQEALTAGYDRLEALVLEHGGAGVALEPADPYRAGEEGAAPPPFDFDKALRILALYRSQRHGQAGRRPGAARRRATREETNAVLIKAIAAAKKRLGLSDDA